HHLWEHAEPIVLVDCVTGREPKMSTQCRLLWDDSFLYAGYLVQDEKVIATYSKRDEPLYEEDVVELFLAPAGSLNYYYEFNFSPKNVVLDAVVFNDGGQAGVGRGNLNTMTEWNCEDICWSTRIQPDQNWAVTAAIPFTSLHFAENHPPKPGDTWRINVCRIEYGLPETEYTAWSPPEILDFHTTEKFGQLIFDPE
ncbi:MAG: carbohydrate-binding family 9-like protein, partial [Calditrichota bacterium]